jgi:hypothetical protein
MARLGPEQDAVRPAERAAGGGRSGARPDFPPRHEALPARPTPTASHDFSRTPLRADSRGALTAQPADSASPGVHAHHGGGEPAAESVGVPLEAPVRSMMEAGFGYDFSAVRVHADERAGDAARSLQARAFTVGADLLFARGAYSPQTSEGLRLLAHELAHVVQQGGQMMPGDVADHSGERAADEAAQVVAVGGQARVTPLRITGPQRSPDPPGPGPARTPALTPEEMWAQLVQSKRGFESSPSGAGDTHRSSPATLPPGSLRLDEAGKPTATGAPLGKGYETFAGVQVVDAEGNRVALAADSFRGGGPDRHAEARCVRALEARGPARVAGGKLVVVSDQTICPTCRQRLINYAKSRGLTLIEPHEPVRPKMVGAGEATPKTTSRSSTQAGRPQLSVVAREPIHVPVSTPPTPRGAPPAIRQKPPDPQRPAAPAAPSVGKSVPAAPTVGKSVPAAPSAPAPAARPVPEAGVLKRGRVSVNIEVTGGRPKVRLTSIDTAGISRDEAPELSKRPKGSALATAMSVGSIARTLLDLYGSVSDEGTNTTIQKLTHPIKSMMRSKIFDAAKEFLATHPDPKTLASRIDAARLRAEYEAEWRQLGSHRARAVYLAIVLSAVPEDERGPDWYAAAEKLKRGVAAPQQDVQSFIDAAEAYESRGIDVMQEIAPFPIGLPQLAAEIHERARMLDTISAELINAYFDFGSRFPLVSVFFLDLYTEGEFVAELAGRMRGFANTVSARYQAYVDVERELDAQMRQVRIHINDPGRAIMTAPWAGPPRQR